MEPICGKCGAVINGVNLGYKQKDVSLSQMDLNWIEIFYCENCGATLGIKNAT